MPNGEMQPAGIDASIQAFLTLGLIVPHGSLISTTTALAHNKEQSLLNLLAFFSWRVNFIVFSK
jgi:hypothetical protein